MEDFEKTLKAVNLRKQINIANQNEDIVQKGKAVPVGTVRGKMIKTANGWKYNSNNKDVQSTPSSGAMDRLTALHESNAKKKVGEYVNKFKDKMSGSSYQTAKDWVDGISGMSDANKKLVWEGIKGSIKKSNSMDSIQKQYVPANQTHFADKGKISKAYETLGVDIEKGKAVPIGTVRGRMIKTADGWKYNKKGSQSKSSEKNIHDINAESAQKELDKVTKERNALVKKENQGDKSVSKQIDKLESKMDSLRKEVSTYKAASARKKDSRSSDVDEIAVIKSKEIAKHTGLSHKEYQQLHPKTKAELTREYLKSQNKKDSKKEEVDMGEYIETQSKQISLHLGMWERDFDRLDSKTKIKLAKKYIKFTEEIKSRIKKLKDSELIKYGLVSKLKKVSPEERAAAYDEIKARGGKPTFKRAKQTSRDMT